MRSLRTLLAAAVVMVVAMPAWAAPPRTETVRDQVTETYIGALPGCEFGGALYEITLTYKVGDHETEFDDGRFHGTYTQSGSFVAVPLDPELPGASGRYTIWNGFNQNNQSVSSGSLTNWIGKFDDGTKINLHTVSHINFGSAMENVFEHCHD